jgi:hypothetical protein
VIQTVGPDALFESYDTNRDGALTKEEALADIRLDQRPLPQVLSDPNSVDWRRLTDRAGMAAPLLKRLFPDVRVDDTADARMPMRASAVLLTRRD